MAKNTDFIGFTFNGRHSSEFNIYSVSDGSRYQDTLVPSPIDYSEQIAGGIGSYYFGSDMDVREFPLSIAYDNLSEKQIREMRKWLAPDGVGDLIFDERPYKAYTAKINGSPTLSFICFDDSNNKRVYKGEGEINFICYYPLAETFDRDTPRFFSEIPLDITIKIRVDVSTPPEESKWEWVSAKCKKVNENNCECEYTYLTELRTVTITSLDDVKINKKELRYYRKFPDKYPNVDEWADSSDMMENLDGYDECKTLSDNTYGINYFNPGDLEAGFILQFTKPVLQTLDPNPEIRISISLDGTSKSFVLLLRSSDTDIESYGAVSDEERQVATDPLEGIITIDTTKNRITYRNSSMKYDSSIYFALKEGKLFKLPVTSKKDAEDGNTTIRIDSSPAININSVKIEYSYLYY